MLCRTKWRAHIALTLMGLDGQDASFAVEREADDPYGDHTLRGMVDAALNRLPAHAAA